MFSFRAGSVKISLDIGFLAVIAVISLYGSSVFIYSFTACIIHELGHLIFICFFNEKVESIAFRATGITIFSAAERMNSFFSDIIILAAGPLLNIVTAFFLLMINKWQINSFIIVNIILGVFNLLPFSALDGGSIIRLMAETFLYDEKYFTVCKVIRMINTMLCISVIIWWIISGNRNITVPVISVFLIISELGAKGID